MRTLAGVDNPGFAVPRADGLVWQAFTVSATDFTAEATSEDIELFSLPATGVIHAVKIKHTTSFNDGGSGSFTLSVGIAGTLTKYAGAFDVFQATGDTVFQMSSVVDSEDHGSATSIRVEAVSDVNVSLVTAGVAIIWVLTSTAN